MKLHFPIINQLKQYQTKNLSNDIMAGITVGIMLVPQGMAYAMLAGLPPIYGLYASTIPLLIYAILGTSRQLAVGPVAMVSLLVASGVGGIATMGSEEYIALAILLALLVGVIQFALGILRMGFLVNFLSHPVIAGFTSAAALIIGFSQLKHLLGLDIPRGKVHETILVVGQHISEVNLPTLIIGLAAILLILGARKINRKIPSPLLVVLLGIGSVLLFGLEEMGVKIIKEVPSGFPAFQLPNLSTSAIIQLLPIAITIALVSYMESYAVAKAIQARHKDYQIDPNQELIALGAANIGGSFFNAFPVTGGFSRTAVNDQAGAKSGIAAIISAFLVFITILFLTQYFYYLPKAILAAIIMVAVFGLIDIKEAKHLWKTDKLDFIAFMITAIATLIIGIEPGIAFGVAFSIILVLYRLAYPHIAIMGRVPNTSTYRNIHRFDNLITDPNCLILRFDAQLFFGNSELFKNQILDQVKGNKAIKTVIMEAGGIHNIDSSAVHMLNDLHDELAEEYGIKLLFSEVKGPLRDKFFRNGLFTRMQEDNFFLTTANAVESTQNKAVDDPREYTMQVSQNS